MRARESRNKNGSARARVLARAPEAEPMAVGGAGARLRGSRERGRGLRGVALRPVKAGGGASPSDGAEGGRNSCSLSTF